MSDAGAHLRAALGADDSSHRLQAALTAGTRPQAEFIDVLVERCGVEDDFYVRDMLTWALTQQDRHRTTSRVVRELAAPCPQARSQALHTLSKIGDGNTWSAITRAHLTDEHPEVARTAWRAAAALVPDEEAEQLARDLATQLGRGARELRHSLTRAFLELGTRAAPALWDARSAGRREARVHAIATDFILGDPALGFDAAMHEAAEVEAAEFEVSEPS